MSSWPAWPPPIPRRAAAARPPWPRRRARRLSPWWPASRRGTRRKRPPGRAPPDPRRGAGGAPALAAAQGGALVAMVPRLSPRDAPEAAAGAVERADRLRTGLAGLVGGGAQAFEGGV